MYKIYLQQNIQNCEDKLQILTVGSIDEAEKYFSSYSNRSDINFTMLVSADYSNVERILKVYGEVINYNEEPLKVLEPTLDI